MFSDEELSRLPSLPWMPSRIPVQDALVAVIENGQDIVPPRPVYETRFFEDGDRLRVLIPYDGGAFDPQRFRLEKGGWDHVTCDWCNVRLPAMTLCYVTREGAFQALCVRCYKDKVVRHLPVGRSVMWYFRRWLGRHAAA